MRLGTVADYILGSFRDQFRSGVIELRFRVDAGGTKTICAIGDTSGRLLAVGEGGPANYKLVGSEAAAEHPPGDCRC